jgi:hypothetical protein
MTERDLTEVIAEYLPYDGPHSRDTVIEAARGVSALVRYLNNATGHWNARATLKWAPTTYSILGGLSAAICGLDQLLAQLAEATEQQATNSTLYDDRHDRPGRDTARALTSELTRTRQVVHQLRDALECSHSLSSHLGHDRQEGPQCR